jgi:hypothetical protein
VTQATPVRGVYVSERKEGRVNTLLTACAHAEEDRRAHSISILALINLVSRFSPLRLVSPHASLCAASPCTVDARAGPNRDPPSAPPCMLGINSPFFILYKLQKKFNKTHPNKGWQTHF